jgi:hypothetical protein
VPVRGAAWDWCCFYWSECCISLSVYGAPVCWRGVDFVRVLLFCAVIINGVKYRVSEVKQYSVHWFIFLMCTINMEFFKAIHMSSFWDICIISFLFCIFPYIICVVLMWRCLCYILLHVCVFYMLFGMIALPDLCTVRDSPCISVCLCRCCNIFVHLLSWL